MDEGNGIPAELLNDPRRLVPKCGECEHRLESGICGLERRPSEEWARPGGCSAYSPIDLGGGGDADPEEDTDY